MTDVKNVDGHFYPTVHGAWGGFAEELFHYTSRYYCTTEAFLRNLVDERTFSMAGYKAALLSPLQRDLMAAVLSCEPDRDTAAAVISIIAAVQRGDSGVEAELAERFHGRLEHLPKNETVEHRTPSGANAAGEIEPLDPFLNLAERLLMPVVVRGRHVEVSMRELAGHLDSANSQVRTNLQNAVIELHNAGYVLRNHPHLTHSEAQALSARESK